MRPDPDDERVHPGERDEEPRGPRLAIVVNPERTELADELVDALRRAGVTDLEQHRPERADDLPAVFRSVLADTPEMLAAVGGDGTQRTAAAACVGRDTRLVVVPGGTVNLLGKVHGIESVDDAVAAITDGHDHEIDVGLVDDEVYLLAASTGFDAEVMHHVGDAEKRLGLAGYATTGLRRLREHRPRRVSVSVDGEDWFDGRAMSVVVANVGERGTPAFRMAPDARTDDGRLDVVVHRCSTVTATLRAGWALLRGRTPDDHDVSIVQASRVDVRWSSPRWSQRDGDDTGRRPTASYRVHDERLVLRVPASVGRTASSR